jgi:hypothetical protein
MLQIATILKKPYFSAGIHKRKKRPERLYSEFTA